MFVLSVLDNGDERNFVTEEIRILDGRALAVIGETSQSFEIDDVIDLVLVGNAPEATSAASHFARQCQPPSDL